MAAPSPVTEKPPDKAPTASPLGPVSVPTRVPPRIVPGSGCSRIGGPDPKVTTGPSGPGLVVHAVLALDALPAEWTGLGDLETGARQAGLLVLRFDHFGNWYEDVGGLDWSVINGHIAVQYFPGC